MFSVLILTRDEEDNIVACLESVAKSNDIVVLDSFSSDRTCELARSKGARVFQRTFDNFAGQRNYAMDNVDFKNEWVFHLDADERFTDELWQECERVVRENRHSGYFVPNRIFFMGRWIRHCTQYPYPQVRLVKQGEIRFAASGHGQRESDAQRGVGTIDVPYDHFNFSKGIDDWFAKHNRYSSDEAKAAAETRSQPLPGLFNSDSISRKRALKSLFRRIPFRPMIKFLYLYLVCRGFLDGKPGYVYCRMHAVYEAMIDIKTAAGSESLGRA